MKCISVIKFCAFSLLLVPRIVCADVNEFADKAEWEAAAGDLTTIDFT